ncbi:MAG: hypothetical protein M1493_02710 [Firmicutes bacterium]|jgi:hypothetical protein|uniref:Uncharacterized protein n=1 Tax=Sulfobacillus benefaciens TaxID=453960 RepID=A0A2T2WG71_9FIRM|nr:hypothetical protein [Bacillota bacterium]PSR21229.1 MAG: hypothetical protein C7B43_21410 [Sulfobacillus benefaciens]
MIEWSQLVHPWFTLDSDTIKALQDLSPILGRVPPETDDIQWNLLLTVWSAYAKSVSALSGVKNYELWQSEAVAHQYEELPKHVTLWGIIDGVQGSMHSALDNLGHAVWLVEYPQKAGSYYPASFNQLFDPKMGLIGAATSTKLSSELIHTLTAIYTNDGKKIIDLNNHSKHKRSLIPRQPIPLELQNNPLFQPLIAQQDSREMPVWFAEVKNMAENILPHFWQALPLVMTDAGY